MELGVSGKDMLRRPTPDEARTAGSPLGGSLLERWALPTQSQSGSELPVAEGVQAEGG